MRTSRPTPSRPTPSRPTPSRPSPRCALLAQTLALALALAAALAPALAPAAPLAVTAIPWVQGQPEAPHVAVRGAPTALQAIAEGGDCGGRYEYRWDWNGDGDFADPQEGFLDAHAADYAGYFAPLPLDVTLPALPGDHLLLPRVEVRCGAEVSSAVMPVMVFSEEVCAGYLNGARAPDCGAEGRLDLTRRLYSARAIDRAMWWLFMHMTHQTGDQQGHPEEHLCRLEASKTMYALGHALTVFLRRGHGHGAGRDGDPYYRHAALCGLNSLLTTMTLGPVSFSDADGVGFAGEGLSFTPANGLSSQLWFSYESTAWAEPVALFGDPGYVATVGGAGTAGRALREISQDLADGLIDCMGADHGWSYVCARGVGVSDDASSNGWAPEALRLLERAYGVDTYEEARAGQRAWLALRCPGGVCPYHGGGPKLSGNALVGYGWADQELFDASGGAGDSWAAVGQWYQGGAQWGLYFIYSVVKGLRSFTPEVELLPSGLHLTSSLVDFFVTGEDAQHADLTARQQEDGAWGWIGDWVWGEAISTPERTAIVTQLLQSWLEVYPYARAFPREVGPGERVTFDHRLTHLLSPGVGISAYRWDVARYPLAAEPPCALGASGCQDLNGDGDCGDAQERCNEDLSGDGLVTGAEVVWELETQDPDEELSHRYLDPLEWGEEVRYDALLEVVDSAGRVSADEVSVAVTVSLRNHPPVPVPHPEGRGRRYVAHPARFATLDGRASYDLDEGRDPYPGDPGRPAGRRDHITSISFDLNLDGDFDDPGEEGLSAPVRLLLPEDLPLGGALSVPMRVCDDGQWATDCLDGLERADCSRCAYSSALIELIPNLSPPVIDTCRAGLPCEDGYDAAVVAAPGGDVVGAVQLDLSESYDPDGDLGLSFSYEVLEGDGLIIEAPSFEGDMGARAQYLPRGEGARVDRLLATVTDSDGLSDSAVIEVRVPNVTPSVSWGALHVDYHPPLIIRAEGRDEWSGRFRVVVDARVVHGAAVRAAPVTRDAGDSYTVYVDFDEDGLPDVTLSDAELAAGAPGYNAPDGYQAQVTAWCVDDDLAESPPSSLPLSVLSKSEDLTYRFDVGDDGSFEEPGTLNNFYTFFNNDPATPSIPVRVEVVDDLGATADALVEVSLQNRPPAFTLSHEAAEGYTVTFVTEARDPDLDALTYSFTPGDGAGGGAPTQESRAGVFVHTYPAAQASYEARVVARDGRGGEAEVRFEISFLPPVDLPPLLDLLMVSAGPGGEAEALVEGHDPEGQPVTITLSWGDGAPPARVVGGRATRDLPYREEPYALTAEVTDPAGQSARRGV